MGRRKTRREKAPNGELSKAELDKLVCYRYAQCGNATLVGKEFGKSRMYVTRAWERLSEEERSALQSTRDEVDEDLNRRIIEAEHIAGDTFMRNIIAARELAGNEILRRFQDVNLRMMPNRDFTALVRLLCNVTAPEQEGQEEKEKQDTFRLRRESIREDIEKSLIN